MTKEKDRAFFNEEEFLEIDNCCEECKKHGYSAFLASGNGMFYNHQDDNNAVLHVNWDTLYAEVKATKLIQAESEIFLDYGKNYPWELTGNQKITLEEEQ